MKNAGGVGMILVNITPGTLDADLHSVPTVHLDDKAAPAVKAYVGGTAEPDRDDQRRYARSASTPRRWPAPPAVARPRPATATCSSRTSWRRAPTSLAATTAFSAAGGEYALHERHVDGHPAHRRYRGAC